MKTYQINYDPFPPGVARRVGERLTVKKTVFTVGFMSKFGFVPKIRSGEKGITIRKPRKDGKLPQVGQIMRMWADQRSPKRERIFMPGELEPRCTGVWPVEIYKNKYNKNCICSLFFSKAFHFSRNKFAEDFSSYSDKSLIQFAHLDGWDTPDEMFNFFKDSLPFKGFIYCWVKL